MVGFVTGSVADSMVGSVVGSVVGSLGGRFVRGSPGFVARGIISGGL